MIVRPRLANLLLLGSLLLGALAQVPATAQPVSASSRSSASSNSVASSSPIAAPSPAVTTSPVTTTTTTAPTTAATAATVTTATATAASATVTTTAASDTPSAAATASLTPTMTVTATAPRATAMPAVVDATTTATTTVVASSTLPLSRPTSGVDMTATSTVTASVPGPTGVVTATAPVPANDSGAPAVTGPITASMQGRYAALGLVFERNDGQTDGQVRFLAHGHGYTVFLTASDAVLALVKPRPPVPLHTLVEQQDAGTLPLTPTQETVLRLHFVGANSAAMLSAEDPLSSTASYVVGRDPTAWHASIATYQRIVYHDIYPGIDLAYHGAHDLEYDWLLAPGADPSLIQFSLEGAQGLAVDTQGNVLARTAVGLLRQTAPAAYQDVDGQRHDVSVRYTLAGNGQVGVALGAYDPSKPLVIDPTLSYSTYLGGSGTDVGTGITTDSAGNAYVVGWTGSANFPVTGGVYGSTLRGATDVFIAKFDPSGAKVWSTYLGGSGDDVQADSQIAGIAVDGSGNVYVSGSTASTDFPVTGNAAQGTYGGGTNDAFVSELNATGHTLLYSTYLGGGCNDYAPALAVDGSGKIYVTGSTCSTNFPILHSLQAFNGGSDAFIVKIDPTASPSLVYSTLLGGYGQDGGYGIAVDAAGAAYVTGDTNASDFPVITSTAAQPSRASYCTDGTCHDAFFSKLNPAGTALLYSTYLGGTHDERALRLALDKGNNAYITGWTSSVDFPTTSGAYRSGPQGGIDAFVVKLNPTASGRASLVYSTYLGGSGDDYGYGIAVDSTGDALITGQTASSDLHPTPDALQGAYGGAIPRPTPSRAPTAGPLTPS